MSLYYFTKRNSLFGRVCSYVLTFVLVLSMALGCVVLPQRVSTSVKAATTAKYRNVMYYGDWSIYSGQKNFTPDKIDGSLITHLNFAFMDADANGDLITTDTWADYQNPNVGYSVGSDNKYAGVLGAMVLLRQKYPNMKIGISVGGWTRSGDFPKLAASDKTRKNFANNVAKFVHCYGYDFVDIDWEYPTADRDPDPEGNGVAIDKGCKGSAADTKNFTLLLQEIRNSLDSYGKTDGKHYELSVAMSASPTMMSAIEYDKVLKIVDFANMMTYDLNGAWGGFTAHQTALYTNPAYDGGDAALSVDSCIKYLENKYGDGIDYSKIVVGVAPYTRGWKEVKKDTGRDPKNPGLYADATGENGVTYAYGDIDSLINQYQLKKYWDDVAKANYFYSESTGMFFTCDTEESVAEKGKYVREKHLGGLISWMASLDSTNSITKTMKESLYGSEALPKQNIIIPGNDGVETTVTASGDTYTITVKNTNPKITMPGGAKDISVMPWAEYFGKTLSYPSIAIETQNGETLSGDWSAGGIITSEDGKTVVTPPEWSSKTLEPGASLTFTLKSGKGTASTGNIKGIVLRQRAVSGGEILSTKLVYGNGGSEGTTVQNTTKEQDVTTTKKQETTKASETTTKKPETTKAPETTTKVAETTTKVPETTSSHKPIQGLNSRLLIGYYHTWDNSGNPFIKLRDVDKNWDVINISFAEPVSAGSTDGKMKFNISGLTADYTKADFKNDVKALQAQGKKIVLSIGGYEGYFSLTSQSAVNQFVSDIKSIVDEYGFDGIDIDLEQSSVQFESGKDTDINNPTSPKIVNMINAIRTIVNSYGDDFILSWAPETFYVQLGYQFYGGINQYCDARAGVYLPMINALRNETTYVHVQLYNSSPMIATDNQSYNMGTKEGIVAMCNMLLNGFYVNNYYTKSQTAEKYFAPLRPDQVVIGVPSSASAAGSGQVSNETLQSAFTELNNAHPGLRGIMTWSINWDSSQNKNLFAQSNGRFLDSLSGEETTKTPEITTKAPETTKVAEITTKAPETTTKAPETTTKTPETTIDSEYPQWNKDTIYTGGNRVIYNGKVYQAKWWTLGENPETCGQWGVWKYVGDATVTQPTTKAPETTTKTVETTTRQEIVLDKPFGLVVTSTANNSITVVWGRGTIDLYNVYIDGKLVSNAVACGSYTYTGYTAGRHTVAVTTTYNGKESEKTETVVDVKSQTETTTKTVETTKAPETEATTAKSEETTKAASGYPEWVNGKVYVKGDKVSYNGNVYEAQWWTNGDNPETCGQWGVWRLTDGTTTKPAATTKPVETTKTPEVTTKAQEVTTSKEEETTQDNNYTVNKSLPEHIVTGYWHNFTNGAANLKLSEVPSYYDLICVSFADSTSTPGEVTFSVNGDLSKAVGGYTDAQFIQDIKTLKERNQHVILSIGGAEGTIYITSQAAADNFANSLIKVIEQFGFEGVDIDLEGGAVAGTEYIAGALRKVHNHFGDEFIITMAPETYYMQSPTSNYFKLALDIKDILTVVNMQYYNSGSMVGYGGGVYSCGSVDFLTSLATLLIENGLRPDQVGIGVPSSAPAAGSGLVSTNTLTSALNCLTKGMASGGSFMPPKTYPSLRGVMTWSINWDASNGYAWGSAMDKAIDTLPKTK